MPAAYAHYRFGAAMLNAMPGDISRSVKRYRRLYDVGLHGPDLFFFYNPLISTKAGKLGGKFHSQTGQEFFTRVCRSIFTACCATTVWTLCAIPLWRI